MKMGHKTFHEFELDGRPVRARERIVGSPADTGASGPAQTNHDAVAGRYAGQVLIEHHGRPRLLPGVEFGKMRQASFGALLQAGNPLVNMKIGLEVLAFECVAALSAGESSQTVDQGTVLGVHATESDGVPVNPKGFVDQRGCGRQAVIVQRRLVQQVQDPPERLDITHHDQPTAVPMPGPCGRTRFPASSRIIQFGSDTNPTVLQENATNRGTVRIAWLAGSFRHLGLFLSFFLCKGISAFES